MPKLINVDTIAGCREQTLFIKLAITFVTSDFILAFIVFVFPDSALSSSSLVL